MGRQARCSPDRGCKVFFFRSVVKGGVLSSASESLQQLLGRHHIRRAALAVRLREGEVFPTLDIPSISWVRMHISSYKCSVPSPLSRRSMALLLVRRLKPFGLPPHLSMVRYSYSGTEQA